MILKPNGQVIHDPLPISDKTADYLRRFWKFPTQQDYQTERENLFTTDNFSH